MTPIINPAFFYWTSVCHSLKFILILIASLFVIASGIFLVALFVDGLDTFTEHEIKAIRALIIATPILVLIAIFVPAKSTLIEMKIAEYATAENIEAVIMRIEEAAQKILK